MAEDVDDNGERYLAELLGANWAVDSFERLCRDAKNYGHGTVCIEFRKCKAHRVYVNEMGDRGPD